MRAAIRLVRIDPSTPPTAPAPRTKPSTPGRTCSTRTAYSVNNARNIRSNKLTIATAMSDARTMALPAMNRRPAVTPPGARSAGGSAGRIRPRKNAEPRKDSASAAIAYGAVSAWASSPPADGPAT
jgi:hypothetical protein